MFSECEKWRIEFEVEHLKHTFVFEEREIVNQYYPQYYHKTDNVYTLQFLFSLILLPPIVYYSLPFYTPVLSRLVFVYILVSLFATFSRSSLVVSQPRFWGYRC